MSTLRVGIIGAREERHCRLISRLLKKRKAEPLLIDAARFPWELHFTLRQGRVFYRHASIDDVKVFFLRELFSVHEYVEYLGSPALRRARRRQPQAFAMAEQERYCFLWAWLKLLESQGKILVNKPETLGQFKPYQLERLREEGLLVPRTLVTNDPQELVRFCRQAGSAIYKPLGMGAHARVLTPNLLTAERLSRLRMAPIMVQEKIEGRPVRVYVVGEQVVSSVAFQSKELDYRLDAYKFTKIDLPKKIQKLCVRAAQAADLLFTGIDLILRDDESVTFLECNPIPQFVGFRPLEDERIGNALADFLIAQARRLA